MFACIVYNDKTHVGKLLLDHVNPGCGGYTGLAVQLQQKKDESKASNNAIVVDNVGDTPTMGGEKLRNDQQQDVLVLYASTITGGLYALQLEHGGNPEGLDSNADDDVSGSRLRCVGFVEGHAIL